jgi:hypothetical protein
MNQSTEPNLFCFRELIYALEYRDEPVESM